jgi:hypothetical protein
VFEDGLVFWSHWTEQIEAMIDASLSNRLSLADVEDYQLYAGPLEDAGVYAAEIYARRDWPWFERRWTLAENEYSRLGASVEQQVYLRPYLGFAIGVGYDGGEPYAVIILLHDDAEIAAQNVPLLQAKVSSEISLYSRRPWSDAISKSDIRQSGRAVYAKLWMPNPGTIFIAWNNLDSLFTSRQ